MIVKVQALWNTWKSINLAHLVGMLLACASFVMSAIGLHTLLGQSFEEMIGGTYISIGLSALISLVIQSLVVWMLLGMFSGRFYGRRAVGAIGVVALCWLISVGLAFGWWWYHISGTNFEDRVTTQQLQAVTMPIDEAINTFSVAREKFSLVDRRAARMAELEENSGRSCGYSAGRGQGKRYRLRQEQESAARKHSNALTTLGDDLRSARSQFYELDNVAIEAAYLSARAVLQNPARLDARAWLEEQRAGFENQFVSAEGGSFTCADPNMLSQIKAAITAFDALTDLPPTVPSRHEISLSDAIYESYGRLLAPLKRAVGLPVTSLVPPTSADFAPLLPAMFVETLMVLLFWLSRPPALLGTAGNKHVQRHLEGVQDPVVRALGITDEKQAMALANIELLETYVLRLVYYDKCFLIVPRKSVKRRNKAAQLLSVFQLSAQGKELQALKNPVVRGVPITQLPNDFRLMAGWKNENEVVSLYSLPNGLYSRIRFALNLDLVRPTTPLK